MENIIGQESKFTGIADLTSDQVEKTFQKKVLVLELHVGQWRYKRPSKKALAAMADKLGIDEKHLSAQYLAADRIYFKPLERCITDFKAVITDHTLGHSEKANYTLPVSNYELIDETIRDFCLEFEKHVSGIASQFDRIKTEARNALNGDFGLFNDLDYPSIEQLTGDTVIHRQGEARRTKGKYYFSYKFKPYTTAGSLQADLVSDSLKDLKKIMEQETLNDFHSVIGDIWDRIFTCTKNLKDAMKKPDRQDKSGEFQAPIFRDSIIGNIKELVNIIPSLNIFEDPAIDQARTELIKELCDIDPQELRDNKEKRIEAEKKADKILNKLPGLF